MNRPRLTALCTCVTLGAVILSWGGGAHTVATTPAETVETATVRLEVEAEPGILISRRNPPLLELTDPFTTDVSTATADGEPYPDDPDYYARLEPVRWEVEVPQGTVPGSYPAKIRATFALCSKTLGFCFLDEQRALTVVQVGGGENATVTLQLRQPER